MLPAILISIGVTLLAAVPSPMKIESIGFSSTGEDIVGIATHRKMGGDEHELFRIDISKRPAVTDVFAISESARLSGLYLDSRQLYYLPKHASFFVGLELHWKNDARHFKYYFATISATDGSLTIRQKIHFRPTKFPFISKDGDCILAYSSYRGEFIRMESLTARDYQEYDLEKCCICTVAFTNSRKMIGFIDGQPHTRHSTIGVFSTDREADSPEKTISEMPSPFYRMVPSPTGESLICCYTMFHRRSQYLYFTSFVNGTTTRIGFADHPKALAWNSDGSTLAYISDKTVRLFQPKDWTRTQLPAVPEPSDIFWEPNSHHIWVVSRNRYLFRLENGQWIEKYDLANLLSQSPKTVVELPEIRTDPKTHAELRW